MRGLTEANLTDAVVSQVNADNPRLQQLMESFIRHLHSFVREVEPTEAEWWAAIDFLTRTGHTCTDERQEFILFSDMLGVTSLVDFINHRFSEGVTETTVTGPFHRVSNIEYENGANIAHGPEWERGEHTLVRGRVLDLADQPIAGAKVDIWQSDDLGFYDVQDGEQPEINLRGLFTTDENGAYWFRTVKPSSYPVPTDGPVGKMLEAIGRHPMRPAHIHCMVTAPGFKRLVTHVYVEGDEYLASDSAFAVKESLVVDFVKNESSDAAARFGFPGPFYEIEFDFVMQPA